MSSTPIHFAHASRRLRAAAPGVHGGASSLLRLARGSDPRLPSGAALSGWADRAAAMLDLTPMIVGPLAADVALPAPPRPAAAGAQEVVA